VARRWQEDIRSGRHDRLGSFAPDAQIFLIQVNLRDAPEGERRRRLLQVPTAFSIGDAEVTSLISAGRDVLRASKGFQALQRSLQAAPDQAAGTSPAATTTATR
jgi:NTE family protein